jgi:hypothetical protein
MNLGKLFGVHLWVTNHVPGGLPPADMFERITYTQRTEEERRETQAPLGASSIAAVTGDFSRPSAQ